MTPIRTNACNVTFTAPDCADLPALVEDGLIYTYWRPNAEELAAINAGLPVRLVIVSPAQPPVCIDVEAL